MRELFWAQSQKRSQLIVAKNPLNRFHLRKTQMIVTCKKEMRTGITLKALLKKICLPLASSRGFKGSTKEKTSTF
jgi:hypothetical protein